MDITKSKRVVVKVGSSTLTHSTGHLNIRRMEGLVKVLSDLQNSGREILLVTSGSVAVGVGKLGLSKRPSDVPTKQACAAIGQCELMYLYDRYFSEYNHIVSQVLLTPDVMDHEERKANVYNTFTKLISLGSIPIINENDTVSFEEINRIETFGDNDNLSALVAGLVHADLLVILTDIDGLYDKDPKKNPDAKLIPIVKDITDDIMQSAGGKGSELGTGGMITKLQAAKKARESGVDTVIICGSRPENLYDLFDGKQIGTRFICDKKKARI